MKGEMETGRSRGAGGGPLLAVERSAPGAGAERPLAPPSAPVGSASTGSTSGEAPANQLVFCHQLVVAEGPGVDGAGAAAAAEVVVVDAAATAVDAAPPTPQRRRWTFAGSGASGDDPSSAEALTGPARNAESAKIDRVRRSVTAASWSKLAVACATRWRSFSLRTLIWSKTAPARPAGSGASAPAPPSNASNVSENDSLDAPRTSRRPSESDDRKGPPRSSPDPPRTDRSVAN